MLYSYDLKFLAVNENVVDRKQGVRFGAFVACGLVNFNLFLLTRTTEIDETVHLLHNFHSLLETLDHSRLLHEGCVNKACIFIISWGFNWKKTL